MRAFDDGDDGGFGDLREKLQKHREERAAVGGGDDAPMEATREPIRAWCAERRPSRRTRRRRADAR